MSSPRHRAGRGEALTLALESETGAAGEAISGDLSGPPGSATVSLVRVEHSPSGTFMFVIGSCKVDLAGAPARFELEVPGALPPAGVGGRCRLDYVVRAEFAYSRWRRRRAVSPVSVTAAERPVHEDPGRLDRVIPSNPARRFHLDLVDALLEGGGHVSGRVHWESEPPEGGFSVTVSCEESWCTNFRFRSRRSPLLWQNERLWVETCAAAVDADRHWSPFRVEIPASAPKAVEGRVIAWRYTVEAVSAMPHLFADRAVVTPLRFEV